MQLHLMNDIYIEMGIIPILNSASIDTTKKMYESLGKSVFQKVVETISKTPIDR